MTLAHSLETGEGSPCSPDFRGQWSNEGLLQTLQCILILLEGTKMTKNRYSRRGARLLLFGKPDARMWGACVSIPRSGVGAIFVSPRDEGVQEYTIYIVSR